MIWSTSSFSNELAQNSQKTFNALLAKLLDVEQTKAQGSAAGTDRVRGVTR